MIMVASDPLREVRDAVNALEQDFPAEVLRLAQARKPFVVLHYNDEARTLIDELARKYQLSQIGDPENHRIILFPEA